MNLKEIAQIQTLRELAERMGEYRKALMDSGFTPDESNLLVGELHNIVLGSSLKERE